MDQRHHRLRAVLHRLAAPRALEAKAVAAAVVAVAKIFRQEHTPAHKRNHGVIAVSHG